MTLLLARGARRAASALALLPLLATPAAAQERRVDYEIAFPNAVHHEAQVTATFRGADRSRPLEVRMARSSPGRYALHEFAKNVYDVKAFDGRGRPLAVTRPNPHQWDVAGHDGTVRVTYTLFGDHADGTYAQIDPTHAHLNIPATFMYARGMHDAPVRVAFRPLPGWRIATQLVPTADSTVFTAPHLQYFMDSPTELSAHALRSWTVAGPGGARYTLRLAVHHQGSEAQVDTFAAMAQKVVAEEIAVWGEPPAYDFGTYTFLADYLPWADGDGMEHRNSTVLTSSRGLDTPAGRLGNAGTLSHEFFHAWNVERFRPRALEPFDFERENMSGELWFAEGFTAYYDDLFLRRAGLLSDEEYARGLAGTVSAVVNAPGRRFFSAVEMSMQAPFVDAAVSVDPQNRGNTFLSYYTFGAGIAAGLDLTLRTRFPSLTLDDYMRALWRDFGREQTAALAPARPYTLADLRRVLGEVAGDRAFADDFFRRYVEGREAVDYEPLLASAGFTLRRPAPARPWLGAQLEDPEEGETGVEVSAATAVGGSLHPAGVDRGDRILSVDGVATPTADSLRAVVARHAPGETVRMEVEQRGGRRTVPVTLAENRALEIVTHEAAGRPVTDAMRELRRRWLGSQVTR